MYLGIWRKKPDFRDLNRDLRIRFVSRDLEQLSCFGDYKTIEDLNFVCVKTSMLKNKLGKSNFLSCIANDWILMLLKVEF